MDAPTRRFVISLIGLSLAAAALVLLIPSLVESGGGARLGIAGALAVAVVGFGVAARYARRALP